MKIREIIYTIFGVIVLCSCALRAQEIKKVQTGNVVKYSYITPEGYKTNVKPVAPKFSAEKERLLKELMKERMTESTEKAQEIRKRLDEIDGQYPSELSNDPALTGVIDPTGGPQIPHQMSGEGDFNNTLIASGNIWAITTQTSSKSTALFAAVTEDIFGSGDICKVYVSYDGGRAWVLKYTFNGFASNVNIRANELDIEPIINGSDTILYVGFGYTMNNHSLSYFMRVNIVNGTSTGGAWNFWGSLHPCYCVNIYNPKITSDNSRYGTNTYVYFTVSRDSLDGGFGGYVSTQQMAVNTSPFSGITLTNRYRNNFCGGFTCFGVPYYVWQDICFYNNGIDDRIYVAFSPTLSRIFCYWSNDYGVSQSGEIRIFEDNIVDQIQLQSCGGTSNQQIAIAYRKPYSSNILGYKGLFSISGGTTLNSFTTRWIDSTSFSMQFISMQSIALSQGRYVFSWAYSSNGINGTHKFSQTNDAGNTFTTPVISSPTGTGAISFGGTHAGYRNSPSPDSSITLYSVSPGTNAYCSYNIISTIGVQPVGNEVPAEYSLSQNYPNPFNPETIFKFAIPEKSKVSLVIYDMLGRVAGTLVNSELGAGVYKVNWNAEGLSSGVYFYRLTAGKFTETKRMVLMK